MPQKELTKFLHCFFIYSEDNNWADCCKQYEATCPLKQWLNRWDKSFDEYSCNVGFTSEILKLLNHLNMFFCSPLFQKETLRSTREKQQRRAEVMEQSSMPSPCYCPPWINFRNRMHNNNNLNWVDLKAY